MAKKRKFDDVDKKLINLVFINAFLIITGLIWLDFLGFLNIRQNVYPVLVKIPGLNFLIPRRSEDPFLLNKEELKKEELVKKLEWDKLDKFKDELKIKEQELKEKDKSIAEFESRLKEKEKELDKKYADKTTYQQKIQQQAKYFTSMKPADAVKRLVNLDDTLVIDIFKEIEVQAVAEGHQSVVPFFLSLMDPDKAASLQRKMTVVEEDNNQTPVTNNDNLQEDRIQ